MNKPTLNKSTKPCLVLPKPQIGNLLLTMRCKRFFKTLLTKTKLNGPFGATFKYKSSWFSYEFLMQSIKICCSNKFKCPQKKVITVCFRIVRLPCFQALEQLPRQWQFFQFQAVLPSGWLCQTFSWLGSCQPLARLPHEPVPARPARRLLSMLRQFR